LIPLYIAKKSDKRNGYNIILDKSFEKILYDKLKILESDLENNYYDEY
jgi:hypothetical protein